MGENYAHFSTQLSSKIHSVYKITLPGKPPQCIKVVTFGKQEKHRRQLYQNHFENVREWIKLRYSGKSLLRSLFKIQLSLAQHKEHQDAIHLKVFTDHYSYPNLYNFYQRPQKNPIVFDIDNLMYYFTLFFELVLRGGSITNFFYTPNNILISRSNNAQHISKLHLNFASTVGLEFIYLQAPILKEDLYEIFPLLPTKISRTKDNRVDEIELNRIIKMKGFVWNIFCFIIKQVPNILVRETKLNNKISFEEVQQLLEKYKNQNTMAELIKNYVDDIKKAEKITGIQLQKLFQRVLVDNCKDTIIKKNKAEKKDCKDATWLQIYEQIFLKNHIAKDRLIKHKQNNKNNPDSLTKDDGSIDSAFKISNEIIKSLWRSEKQHVRNFYLDRSIPAQSIIYFLVRTNVQFKKIMNHLNILQFIDNSNFSRELLQAHLGLIQTSIQDLQGFASREFVMPYRQVKPIPSPFKISPQEQEMLRRISNPLSMAQNLNRPINQNRDSNPIYIAHYALQSIIELEGSFAIQFDDYK